MNILSALLEISIYSAVLLLAILLLKKVLRKKLSAGIQFALWALFILRLLIPFSIDSGLHLVTYDAPPPAPAYVQEYATNDVTSSVVTSSTKNSESMLGETTIAHPDNASEHISVTPAIDQPSASQPIKSFTLTLPNVVLFIWLCGVLISLIYMTAIYIKLCGSVYARSTAVMPAHVFRLIQQCEQRMGVKHPCEVRISNDFGSTVLLAGLRPKLIIPMHMLDNTEVLEHCLLHEYAHYKRRDYLTYLLTNLLSAVYWFNPCVWIGTRLMKQDMESACDALVIRTMNDDERDKYARTLLSMFSNQPKRFQIAMGMSIATKKEAEKRLRGVYMRRKTSVRTKLTVIVLALIMIFACFTTACQPIEAEILEKEAIAAMETPAEDETSVSPTSLNTSEVDHAAPETWVDTIDRGNLKIEVDAEIQIMQAAQYPVIQAEPVVFTDDDLTGLIEYFTKDKNFSVRERSMGEMVDDQFVITEEKSTNGTDIYLSIDIQKNFLSIDLENDHGDTSKIAVFQYDHQVPQLTSFYCVPPIQFTDISSCQNGGTKYEKEAYQRLTAENFDISQEEATAQAQQTFKDLDISNMQLVIADRILIHKDENTMPDISNSRGGYFLVYHQPNGIFPEPENTVTTTSEYHNPYLQESVVIIVSEQGIEQFCWGGRYNTIATVSEHAAILPLEQMQQPLFDYLAKTFAPVSQQENDTICIRTARLLYGFQVDKTNQDRIIIVPVWEFHIFDQDDNIKGLLLFNATDGRFIEDHMKLCDPIRKQG